MRYLSVCAIFRNENSWLDEWIQYHERLGVEHFYLYNHDDDTQVSDLILRPYVERGLVDNIHVNDDFHDLLQRIQRSEIQNAVQADVMRRSAGQTQWLAVIDLDELILPRCTNDLRSFLEEFEPHSGLAMNWNIFGTSGFIRRPPDMLHSLVHRAEDQWGPNGFVKSIIRPDRVNISAIYGSHQFPCHTGETVNENHEPVNWHAHSISTNKIRVNHYLLRSWQDFWEVKATRGRFGRGAPFDSAYFDYHDRNEVPDDEISRRFGNHDVQRHDFSTTSNNIVSQTPVREQRPRIKVVQYMYGDSCYFPWSRYINERYCRRHGYTHIVSDEKPSQPDRHLNWHKVTTMIQNLYDCDYLLLTDADTIFYAQELKIERELLPLMDDKLFLFAQDVVSEQTRWTPGYPNAGAILIKNSDQSLEILRAWDDVTRYDSEVRWKWPLEQIGLWRHILPKYGKYFHVHEDYYMIHSLYSMFLRHFCSMPDEMRRDKMIEYCRTHSIPIPEHLCFRREDSTKEYNTPISGALAVHTVGEGGLSMEIFKRVGNYTRAITRWIKAGRPVRSSEEIGNIYVEHCSECEHRNRSSSTCCYCGCHVSTGSQPMLNKIAMGTEGCPIQRW
ncbi:MAG: glycosyltransferase family 92 protein [Thermoguttaceae bacterium]|nr:glycosyltransferase family 92 protein [Thermoguttaceae bacterium]